MMNLEVVPLHYIDPLPDAGIDARLVGKVAEWSMVHLYNQGVGSSTIMFPLD